MKLLHDIREAVRLLRGGEFAVFRGSVLGLHFELFVRPYNPAVGREPTVDCHPEPLTPPRVVSSGTRCLCGHTAAEHVEHGYGACWGCACNDFEAAWYARDESR